MSTKGEPRRDLFPVRSGMCLKQVFGDGRLALWQPMLWCTGAIAEWILNGYLPEATEYFLQTCIKPWLPFLVNSTYFSYCPLAAFSGSLPPFICVSYTQQASSSLASLRWGDRSQVLFQAIWVNKCNSRKGTKPSQALKQHTCFLFKCEVSILSTERYPWTRLWSAPFPFAQQ